MDSTLMDSEGLLWGQRIQIQEEVLPAFDNPVVWVHSQTKSVEAESAPNQREHSGQSKQQRKFEQIGHCRGANGKKGGTPTGPNLQSDKQLPGWR